MSFKFLIDVFLGMFGIRTEAEPNYTIREKDDTIQIRLYDSYIIAKTSAAGAQKEAANKNFSTLAGYIFGNNRSQAKIAMTVPVLQAPRNEKLPMTVPVFQENNNGIWEMSFVMPPQYTLATLPVPNSDNVKFELMPARLVAALRYSGNPTIGAAAGKSAQLLKWLEQKPYKILSAPITAQYDQPFSIPFLKRNEIHVVIADKD